MSFIPNIIMSYFILIKAIEFCLYIIIKIKSSLFFCINNAPPLFFSEGKIRELFGFLFNS